MFKIETVLRNKLKGQTWEDVDQGEIVMIFVSHGRIISHLQFLHVKDGNFSLSERRGELIDNLDLIKLDYPSEYVIGVSGRHGVIGTDRVLKSITFVTNKNSYGPFPKNRPSYMGSEDTEFNINVGNHGWLNGFHGTVCGTQLESFGVYIKPIPITKDNDYDKIDIAD